MKLNEIKCPHCGNTNTRVYAIENASIWDDSHYDTLKQSFTRDLLKMNSHDNVIYSYTCKNCGNYFGAMVEMNISVKNIVVKNNVDELKRLKNNG